MHGSRWRAIGLVAFLSWPIVAFGRARHDDRAAAMVRAALDAMGGVARVRSIVRVRIEGVGYAVGDVAHGEPPALTVFAFVETRDDRHPRLTQDVHVLARPGVARRHRRTTLSDDWFAEAPENVLLAALAAADLATDSGTAVRFTWRGRTVRVRFAPTAAVPTAVTLGDSSGGVTTVYSRWRRERASLVYPHQWDISRRGTAAESFTADRVVITCGRFEE